MFARKGTFLLGMFVVVIASLFIATISAHAAPLEDIPVTVTQPDGTVLSLLASGDEFYNWLHDAQGYTVIQDPDTGYYVYADLVNGKLVPTGSVVGQADPAAAGLKPYLNISPEQMGRIRQAFLDQTEQMTGEIGNAPTTGTITNLVVFIRFSGEPEFTDATSIYTDMLNSSTAGANSLRNYYREVSYNSLTVNSILFPTPGTTVVSYQDSHPRTYYEPYNAATNPGGYTSENDRTLREHTLLRDAINYVSGLGQFPGGGTIDADGDGIVDSLAFVVSGSPGGWNDLLWPHAWTLYTYTVTINGKTVSRYQFQLQSTINTGVLAHETFHVLGARDLYHYSYDGLQPVGGWDVMEVDADPPQHMGCYMKFRYGHWISSIPQLDTTGTYSLNPLTSSSGNCFKIASPYSSTEYFVLEYRSRTGSTFENSLPGSGLLVYRINSDQDGMGNAGGPPDEVYIYRPGGTVYDNGNVNLAYFSASAGRTSINDTTNPSSFLSDGSPGGLDISGVTSPGSTISFHYTYTEPATGVEATGAWTADDDWNDKTSFNAGDPILWVIDVYNQTDSDAEIDLGVVVLDPNGSEVVNFQGTVTTPAGEMSWGLPGAVEEPAGIYTFTGSVTYQGSTTSASTTYSVAVNPPGAFNKTSPVNGATGQSSSPTLQWGSSSGTGHYEYCYDTSNDNACSGWTSNGTSTSVTLGLNAGTTYYWHVRAVNGGGTTYSNGSSTAFWSFTTAVNPPAAFNKSNPANGATGQSGSPTLQWGSSSGADYYEYCYDTTNDNACFNWMNNGASTGVTPSLNAGTTYYWHVRAVNGGGTTYSNGGSTAFWSFTTAVNPPAAFNKSSPVNGAAGQSSRPTLQWGWSSGTAYYEYCYDTTDDNACSTWTNNGTSTSVTPGLNADTTYYWHVRAVNGGGMTYSNGSSTAFWSFTTAVIASFTSTGAYDGWILESTETGNKGGTRNAIATTFNVGDDVKDRQYRSFLSFDTSGLPDGAFITKAVLQIKRQKVVGTNPFNTHGGLKVDIRQPYFGGTAALAIGDFQAGASKLAVATFNKTPAAGAWYSAVLSSTAYPYINKTGTTQFRLRFAKDDNDDMSADYLKFYSGNAAAAYQPVLVIEYYVP